MLLFSYQSMSGMSGVISPTNLSMYSPNVNTARGTQRSNMIPRWSTPLFTLDQEDFSMITHPVSGSNPETGTVILMDDTATTGSASEHNQCCTSSNLMCEADRFFQASVPGDGLDTSSTRDNESIPTPKSPWAFTTINCLIICSFSCRFMCKTYVELS